MALSEVQRFNRQWLVEELFLNSCVPYLRSQIRRRTLKCCEGCAEGSANAMVHECYSNYEKIAVALIPESTHFMDEKRHKIIKRMGELLEKDILSERFEYGYLTALEILEFLGYDEEDPFKKIGIATNWHKRLQKKVIEDSEMIFPVREPTVEKPPYK